MMSTPEPGAAKRAHPFGRYGCAVVFVVAAGLTVWGVRSLWAGIRASLAAEERLHATILVCDAIGQFLQANGYTAWPRSWEELEKNVQVSWGPYSWPGDASRVEQLVTVEFDTRLEDVVMQDDESFRAVRPNGPAYVTYKGAVGQLLEDIRKNRTPNTEGKPESHK